VQKLSTEIGTALTNPDMRKRFGDMGLVAKSSTPDELGQFLQSEITRWRAVLTKKP
jgi:tripartite-type tricarboxylate transporter receptor subunit TctC